MARIGVKFGKIWKQKRKKAGGTRKGGRKKNFGGKKEKGNKKPRKRGEIERGGG